MVDEILSHKLRPFYVIPKVTHSMLKVLEPLVRIERNDEEIYYCI